MPRPDTDIVFSGKINMLRRAKVLLDARGIRSRHSTPHKSDGVLRVSFDEAERARRLLTELEGEGARVIPANEAAWFRCPVCEEGLSEGEKSCPACGCFVG